VDEQAARSPRFEPELLDCARPVAFLEDRPHLPGLAGIVSDEQKRISRGGLHVLASHPAVLQIDELDLVERGAADTAVRFGPCAAGIIAGKQYRKQRRATRMQVSRQED